MIEDGYRIPRDATLTEAKMRAEQERAAAEHAPKAKQAARRDREREVMRERPARRQVSAAVRRELRARASVEAELRFQLRANSASRQACIETKQVAQERRRNLDPRLQRARQEAARAKANADHWRDPSRAARYVEALERLEDEAADLDETAQAMRDEQAQLNERAQEIMRVLSPLTAWIDAACRRLQRTRMDLGLAIYEPRGPADVIR